MPGTQSTTDSPGLSIDIAGFVATQEKRHSSYLIYNSTSLQRIQLANLPLRTTISDSIKHHLYLPVSITPEQMALTRTPVPVS